MKPFAVFGLIVLSLTAFRFYYYGSLIPNSIIAKSLDLRFVFGHPGGALKYLWDFGVSNVGLALTFLVSIYLAAISIKRKDPRSNVVLLSCGMIALSYAIAFRNYGDWMENHRLLIQYIPLYAVILLHFSKKEFDRIVGIPTLNTSMIVFVFCASLAYMLHYVGYEKPPWHTYNDPEFLESYGNSDVRLTGVLRPTDVISAEALGHISYKLINSKFHDPLGLADPVGETRDACTQVRKGRHKLHLGDRSAQLFFFGIRLRTFLMPVRILYAKLYCQVHFRLHRVSRKKSL